MLEGNQETIFETQYVCVIAILIAFAWNQNKKMQFKKRISRCRTPSSNIPDDDKIIIALQIKNLFVQCSNQKLKNFLPLEIQKHQQTVMNKIKGLFGYGAYYKILHQRTKIKSYLKNLRSIDNVQLYLYTSLHKSFAQRILKKLGIQDYFPEQFRRYCEEEDAKVNEKKHPSWIDHNTRRVMIVTPNKQDYDEQDKKYFLLFHRIKKQKLLKSSFSLIKQILEKASSVDELHMEMDQVKAQIQSDYQTDQYAALH